MLDPIKRSPVARQGSPLACIRCRGRGWIFAAAPRAGVGRPYRRRYTCGECFGTRTPI